MNVVAPIKPFVQLGLDLIFLEKAEEELEKAVKSYFSKTRQICVNLEKNLLELISEGHPSLKILKIIVSEEVPESNSPNDEGEPITLFRQILIECLKIREKHFAREGVWHKSRYDFPIIMEPRKIVEALKDLNEIFWKDEASIVLTYDEEFYHFKFNRLA